MAKIFPEGQMLWQGTPSWRAVVRDVMHIGWIAAYLMLLVIWDFASDRSDGLSVPDTLFGALPIFLLGLVVLGLCAGFAVACARTTTYTLTTDRLILRYGVALPATMTIPLRLIGAVAVQARADGTADIALALKPGSRVQILRLWPHVRPRRLGKSQPMLRGVPGGVAVAALVSQTVAAVSPGVMHAAPNEARGRAVQGPILSPAGD